MMKNTNKVIKFLILIPFIFNLSCSRHELKIEPLEDRLPCPQGYRKVDSTIIPDWIFDKDKYEKRKQGYTYFVGQSEFVYNAEIAKSLARDSLFTSALVDLYGMIPQESKREIESSQRRSDERYNPTLKRTIKRDYIITSNGKSIIFDTPLDYHLLRCFDDQTGKSLYQCWFIAGMNIDPMKRLPHPEETYEKYTKELKKIKAELIQEISITIKEQAKKHQDIMKNIFNKLVIQGDIIKKDNSFYARGDKFLKILEVCGKLNNYYRSITFDVKKGDKWSLGNCARGDWNCKVLVLGPSREEVQLDIARNNNCINNAFNLTVECRYDRREKLVIITDPVYREIFFNYFNLERTKTMGYNFCVNDER